MGIGEFFILLVTIAGLFLWNRSESRSDYRHMEARTEAIINAIREDIKDFHTRLCTIEERNKKK